MARRSSVISECIQKRTVAMFGSWLYCSKNIHCSTRARSKLSLGRNGGTVGEIEEDGIRLGEELPVVEFEQRDAAVGVLLEERRRARLAFQNVQLDAFERACRAG